MNIVQRQYRLLSDYEKVNKFLRNMYNTETYNSYLLQPFFEHAHHSYKFNHKLAHRFGIWEENNELIGFTCFEMNLGECFIILKAEHDHILIEIINYAEKNLSEEKNGKRALTIWLNDKETKKKRLLEQMGYKITHSDPITIFSYEREFPNRKLPDGFKIISLEEENDLQKINDCLWYGFDNGPNPYPNNDAIDRRMQMQSDLNFRKDLTTVIKAPNGEYACYAGMRIEEDNKYAYLEPLATVPKYRRMGLSTIALGEGIRKTKNLGMKYCFGGCMDFYYSIGFEKVGYIEFWKKEW